MVLRSTNDVRRDILAHQAVWSEPGSVTGAQAVNFFVHLGNAMAVADHTLGAQVRKKRLEGAYSLWELVNPGTLVVDYHLPGCFPRTLCNTLLAQCIGH
ncbi:hypothetical protein PspS35_10880 [Pseudomonas sp. S35]|nr:hypothetical protein PspS35_10880 [Pseudomonas sp. S35]